MDIRVVDDTIYCEGYPVADIRSNALPSVRQILEDYLSKAPLCGDTYRRLTVGPIYMTWSSYQ